MSDLDWLSLLSRVDLQSESDLDEVALHDLDPASLGSIAIVTVITSLLSSPIHSTPGH